MSHRLPKTLRIMSHRVQVVLVEGLQHHDGHSYSAAYGQYDPSIISIDLRKEDSVERNKVTLLHEALHAMIDVSNMAEANSEEESVTRLAPLLLNFIRENKAAIAFLQEVS